MRTTALFLTLLTIAAVPASAQITSFTAFEGRADCNGWSVDATAQYRDEARMIRLEYVVVLSDAGGVEVERFEYSDWVDFTAGQSATMSLEGSWTNPANSGWTVRGDFTLVDIVPDLEDRYDAFFETTLNCTTDTGGGVDPDLPVCAYSARWYRHHEDQWPTDQLEIGGETYGANKIMKLLRLRARNLVAAVLARQVVAAKFNLLLNPDADMDEAIAAADEWLTGYPPMKNPAKGLRSFRAMRRQLPVVRALIIPLLRFNFSGCADEPADKSAANIVLDDLEKAFDEVPAPEEDVSFGALKAMYR